MYIYSFIFLWYFEIQCFDPLKIDLVKKLKSNPCLSDQLPLRFPQCHFVNPKQPGALSGANGI
jgi:hypothetical protein